MRSSISPLYVFFFSEQEGKNKWRGKTSIDGTAGREKRAFRLAESSDLSAGAPRSLLESCLTGVCRGCSAGSCQPLAQGITLRRSLTCSPQVPWRPQEPGNSLLVRSGSEIPVLPAHPGLTVHPYQVPALPGPCPADRGTGEEAENELVLSVREGRDAERWTTHLIWVACGSFDLPLSRGMQESHSKEMRAADGHALGEAQHLHLPLCRKQKFFGEPQNTAPGAGRKAGPVAGSVSNTTRRVQADKYFRLTTIPILGSSFIRLPARPPRPRTINTKAYFNNAFWCG